MKSMRLPVCHRAAVAAAFVAAVVLAALILSWWVVIQMSVDFYAVLAAANTAASSANVWADASLSLLFIMWAVMMAAMMLPSFLPTAILFRSLLIKKGAVSNSSGHLLNFIAAYLFVWLAFSFAAAVVQYMLATNDTLRADMVLESPLARAALLFAAGAFQFSALKFSCLKGCRHPAFFFLLNWRGGGGGALLMGGHNGLLCLGCCGLLMMLLFVGGVMHLGWIAGLTAYVMIEKWLPVQPQTLARGAGVLLLAAAAVELAFYFNFI